MSPGSTEPFVEAVKFQDQRLRALRQSGKKILGYFCTYTPIELVHAAGFQPVRIMGGTGTVSLADKLSPAFICPYMRRALEQGLTGQYDYLSGLIQAYTCDAACGVMRVWEQNIKGEIFHSIPLPYNDNDDSRSYLRAEFQELISKMQAIGGRFSEEALEESLELYGDIRNLMLELYRMRYDGLVSLSASRFLSVILAGFVTPPEEYRSMIGELLADVRRASSPSGVGDGVPVLVSGSLIEDPTALDILEESGGKVVADDLCTGLRNFMPASGTGSDPIERLMDRYMNRFPCPARTRATDRAPLIAELVERSRARGVVFLFQKFCTPHLADHPHLVEELKRQGIPNIVVEMDETGPNEGQLRTRFEAFFEMLRA